MEKIKIQIVKMKRFFQRRLCMTPFQLLVDPFLWHLTKKKTRKNDSRIVWEVDCRGWILLSRTKPSIL